MHEFTTGSEFDGALDNGDIDSREDEVDAGPEEDESEAEVGNDSDEEALEEESDGLVSHKRVKGVCCYFSLLFQL